MKLRGNIYMKREEINGIVRNSSNRGFVDWYHASHFTSELRCFLESKVKLLIERNYLEQAFELTNLIFHCVGNIDMDDSDGGSAYVADGYYECWKLILQKISKWPGGREVVSQIANQWRVEYKRRSAMMDELRKIGL